jgi:hypothetical protein
MEGADQSLIELFIKRRNWLSLLFFFVFWNLNIIFFDFKFFHHFDDLFGTIYFLLNSYSFSRLLFHFNLFDLNLFVFNNHFHIFLLFGVLFSLFSLFLLLGLEDHIREMLV